MGDWLQEKFNSAKDTVLGIGNDVIDGVTSLGNTVIKGINNTVGKVSDFIGEGVSLLKKIAIAAVAVPILAKVLTSGRDNRGSSKSPTSGSKGRQVVTPQAKPLQSTGGINASKESSLISPDITGQQKALADITKVETEAKVLISQSQALAASSKFAKTITPAPKVIPKNLVTLNDLVKILIEREDKHTEALLELIKQVQMGNQIANINNMLVNTEIKAYRGTAYGEMLSALKNKMLIDRKISHDNSINQRIARKEYHGPVMNRPVMSPQKEPQRFEPERLGSGSGGGLFSGILGPLMKIMGLLGLAYGGSKLFNYFKDKKFSNSDFGGYGRVANAAIDAGNTLMEKGKIKTISKVITRPIVNVAKGINKYNTFKNWATGAKKVAKATEKVTKTGKPVAKLTEQLTKLYADVEKAGSKVSLKEIQKVEDKLATAFGKNEAAKLAEKEAARIAAASEGKITKGITNKIVQAVGIRKVGAEVSEEALQVGLKMGAKAAGKTASKSLAKKLPFVGAGAGAYFAYDRIKDGDMLGAGAEFVSGVVGGLGSLIGWGTLGSIAIDAWLAYRDMAAALEATKALEGIDEVMGKMKETGIDTSSLDRIRENLDDLSTNKAKNQIEDLKRMQILEQKKYENGKLELDEEEELSNLYFTLSIEVTKNQRENIKAKYKEEKKKVVEAYEKSIEELEKEKKKALKGNEEQYKHLISIGYTEEEAKEKKKEKDKQVNDRFNEDVKKLTKDADSKQSDLLNSKIKEESVAEYEDRIERDKAALKDIDSDEAAGKLTHEQAEERRAKLDPLVRKEKVKYNEKEYNEAEATVRAFEGKKNIMENSQLASVDSPVLNGFGIGKWGGKLGESIAQWTMDKLGFFDDTEEVKNAKYLIHKNSKAKEATTPAGAGDIRIRKIRHSVGSPDDNRTIADRQGKRPVQSSLYGDNLSNLDNSFADFAESLKNLGSSAMSGFSTSFTSSGSTGSLSSLWNGGKIVDAVKYNKDVDGAKKHVVDYLRGMVGKLGYSMSGTRDPKNSTKTADCSSVAKYSILDVTGIDPGGDTVTQIRSRKGNLFDQTRIDSDGVGEGRLPDKSVLEPGDIMFFRRNSDRTLGPYHKDSYRVGHAGVYVGDGMYIHHPGHSKRNPSGVGPLMDPIDKNWKDYIGAKRFITEENLSAARKSSFGEHPKEEANKPVESTGSPLPSGEDSFLDSLTGGDLQYELEKGGDRMKNFQNDPFLKDIGLPLLGFGSHVTSLFGSREAPKLNDGTEGSAEHEGIDLSTGLDTTPLVTATEYGRVVAIEKNKDGEQLGNVIYKSDSGHELQHFHIEPNPELKIGSRIKKGDILGQVAPTSKMNSHLHFGVKDSRGRFIDPLNYLDNFRGQKQKFVSTAPMGFKPPSFEPDEVSGSGDSRTKLGKGSTSEAESVMPIIHNDNKQYKGGDTFVNNITNYNITQNNAELAELL